MENIEHLLGGMQEQLRAVKEDLHDMKQNIDNLLAFKWQLIGASLALSTITTILIEVIKK